MPLIRSPTFSGSTDGVVFDDINIAGRAGVNRRFSNQKLVNKLNFAICNLSTGDIPTAVPYGNTDAGRHGDPFSVTDPLVAIGGSATNGAASYGLKDIYFYTEAPNK